ncbi:VOC family protein [bacterium]|nr:VOC family protein [bacterium]
MGMQLDHIGIAVRSLAESAEAFAALIGIAPEDIRTREVAAEKVRVAEFELDGMAIELMEPMSDDSPISGFLAKRGPGVHHLCFRTGDIEGLFARLQGQGVQMLSDGVRRGDGYRYFFVHPRSAAGILTEFKQPNGEL